MSQPTRRGNKNVKSDQQIVDGMVHAASAPTVNDDSTAGYQVGARWTDTTTDKIYRLTDDTAGAAVWGVQIERWLNAEMGTVGQSAGRARLSANGIAFISLSGANNAVSEASWTFSLPPNLINNGLGGGVDFEVDVHYTSDTLVGNYQVDVWMENVPVGNNYGGTPVKSGFVNLAGVTAFNRALFGPRQYGAGPYAGDDIGFLLQRDEAVDGQTNLDVYLAGIIVRYLVTEELLP